MSKRFYSWSTEKLNRIWNCRNCDREQYPDSYAWYFTIYGPYCTRCRYSPLVQKVTGADRIEK